MKQKEIVITVGSGGIKIEANGYTGKNCLEATAYLESLLSGAPGQRTQKPEFHQDVQIVRQQGTGN